MRSISLIFDSVHFSYDSSPSPVLADASFHLACGWTGLVGANGAGKTTLAKLAAGHLLPTRGTILLRPQGAMAHYVEQDTEYLPAHAGDFMLSDDNRAGELRSLLGIDGDWPERWSTLSHGERKRLQTGIALWIQPDLLVLDEPTNHLDASSRRFIAKALRMYDGVGMLISHDRALLDDLCGSCLFVSPESCVLRPGNVTTGLAQEEAERHARRHAWEESRAEYHRLKRSVQQLREREAAHGGSLSKRSVDRHDHDAKARIDLARLTGKDSTAARKLRNLENRRDAQERRASAMHVHTREIEGFEYRGVRHHRRVLLRVEAGSVPITPERMLQHPELVLQHDDRIALTGDNGTGKSTLLAALLPRITLEAHERIVILQELDRVALGRLKAELQALPGRDRGRLLAVIHQLGSEPERILASPAFSPGEARKIMLAMGLLRTPSLIIMDEPTNHMDLPSVRCLEEALRNFAGALLLVTHDARFAEALTTKRWRIAREEEGEMALRVE